MWSVVRFCLTQCEQDREDKVGRYSFIFDFTEAANSSSW